MINRKTKSKEKGVTAYENDVKFKCQGSKIKLYQDTATLISLGSYPWLFSHDSRAEQSQQTWQRAVKQNL